MWIGANVNYVVLVTGALAVTQGLSFWESISAILIGNVLGCCVLGLSSIMGPKTGSAAIITSRPSFGQMGAILPIFISTIAAIGWFSINSIVATQSLIEVFKLVGLPGSAFFDWLSLLIVLAAEITVALYGHATIISAERLVSMALILLFLGLLLCVLPHLDWAHAAVGRKPHEAHFSAWLLILGLIFSYPVSWTNFASDYSRYLPAATPWRAIAKSAGAGQFVVFAERNLKRLILLLPCQATYNRYGRHVFLRPIHLNSDKRLISDNHYKWLLASDCLLIVKRLHPNFY